MIAGYHIIFGAYGFWLPNDPRGSWSDFVGARELFRYGRATKTNQRRSLAGEEHDFQLRRTAKKSLKYPAVEFDDRQVASIAAGFAGYFARSHVPIWACAIMPDHIHLVVGRPRYKVEQLVIQIKGDATQELVNRDVHPFGTIRDRQGRVPKCFARGEWKVYLDQGDIPRAIRYVEDNPRKEGRAPQVWDFVQEYTP